jgi:DeoR family ulaG and ulaABCDEF operon transcriptional repressor
MASRLMALGGNRVVLPGGEIYADQQLILSAYERDTVIDQFYGSKLFMGAHAIRPHGLIETDPLLIKGEQKLIRQTEELIVLADSSKFQPRGSLIFCPLERIDRLITDDDAPEEALEMLAGAGVDVIIAPTGGNGEGS